MGFYALDFALIYILGLQLIHFLLLRVAPESTGEESLAAWSRMIQVKTHSMMVHSAAHLPIKAAQNLGSRPLLLLELYTALH